MSKFVGPIPLLDTSRETAVVMSDALHGLTLTGARIGIPATDTAKRVLAAAVSLLLRKGERTAVIEIVTTLLDKTRGAR